MLIDTVEEFLKKNCNGVQPFLLALSGGPDSTCLFFCLLKFRQKTNIPFHVAHVDHGWRTESSNEALILKKLADDHSVPFHLKKLENMGSGNLEAICRNERYQFFKELSDRYSFQAVLTGHHGDDRSETVLKRVLEGAHWSRWNSLSENKCIFGIRVLRPLIHFSKKHIESCCINHPFKPFIDSSNRNQKFLRARMREDIFPYLKKTFGKDFEKNLGILAEEAGEITNFFNQRLAPILEKRILGPFGSYLEIDQSFSMIEIKYLLRLLSVSENFFLSREMIELAAHALKENRANIRLSTTGKKLIIDRLRVFILNPQLNLETAVQGDKVMQDFELESLTIGDEHSQKVKAPPIVSDYGSKNCVNLSPSSTVSRLKWSVELNHSEAIYSLSQKNTSWQEGWKGVSIGYIPLCNYDVSFHATPKLKKTWNQAKVPAFLYPYFPVIWHKELPIHEFLTGKENHLLKEGDRCLKLEFRKRARII